jgi:hypothetical protein
MPDLWDEILRRPAAAITAGMEALAGPGSAGERLERAVARLAHTLSAAPAMEQPQGNTAMPTQQTANSLDFRISDVPPELEIDASVLPTVPLYLARGLDLKRWWDVVERDGGPQQQFPLERSFNRPTRSYGFFAEAPVEGKLMPVMGNVQEMFYDQTRAPASLGRDSGEWALSQMREFVMKYFMRISSFRLPETYTDATQPVPPSALAALSWCQAPTEQRKGFGFSQLFNKPAGSDVIEPFPSYLRSAIVDQRDVGRLYEWLLLQVRIFDFSFNTRPFGERGPELVFSLNEGSYLVVHEDFIRHKERHLPGVLGDYGIGYAFVRSPIQSLFAYGPGEFDAAIELINFRIYETGYISVRMIFISNRPTGVLHLVVDPVDWSFRLADAFSFGMASRVLRPAKGILERLPLRFTIDPVSGYVAGANLISNGSAAQTLCISQETLEKLFLVQHFRQHYQTILGSLETWRFVSDWLDEKNLPPWVISGLN